MSLRDALRGYQARAAEIQRQRKPAGPILKAVCGVIAAFGAMVAAFSGWALFAMPDFWILWMPMALGALYVALEYGAIALRRDVAP